MLPVKLEKKFIQITTDYSGTIVHIEAGKFALSEFLVGDSIYKGCPFLETILEVLPLKEIFLMDSMFISAEGLEYNVDVDLFKTENTISVIILNRTNIYKYVKQLNQNRNEVSIIKHEIERQNKELAVLRKAAEKANEEKSRFLAMMSHEVRNPLNAILGYANMIGTESTCSTALDYVKSLTMAGNNLKVIVNDILDLSRIEAGKLELAIEPMSIQETVENCMRDFKLLQKDNNVLLHFEISDETTPLVLGDTVRCTQIISNLINNAYKFTKIGSVTLNVSLNSETDKLSTINFEIKDTGRGMSQDQMDKIFNEYEQVELNDNRIYGGAGLGLSIVKRLVDAMNGTIRVESEIDVGSIFSVQIPFEKIDSSELDEINTTNVQVKNYNLENVEILYADDDELNHVIVAHLLSKEGATTTLVNDGVEALLALKKKTFDLILLDIHMPHKSGEELIKEKHLFTEFNGRTPVLALTANTNKKDINHFIELGFNDVISKPYTADELLSTISLYLK